MAELGWMAVRVRGLTRGGYLEQVRGYCRERSTTPDQQSRTPTAWICFRVPANHSLLRLCDQLGMLGYILFGSQCDLTSRNVG